MSIKLAFKDVLCMRKREFKCGIEGGQIQFKSSPVPIKEHPPAPHDD